MENAGLVHGAREIAFTSAGFFIQGSKIPALVQQGVERRSRAL
jgi:hypothetical protein